MSVFMCPICDEALTSPPPNYEVETAQAQELTGEPVLLSEVPRPVAQTARRGRGRLGIGRLPIGIPKGTALPKKQREAKSSIVSTPCGHLFHSECINQWFKTTSPRTCPTCRKACQVTKMNSLFPVLGDYSQSFSAGSNSSNVFPSTSRAFQPGPPSPQRSSKRTKVPTVLIDCETGGSARMQTTRVVEILDDGPATQGTSGSHVPANSNPANLEELRQTHNTLMQDYEELQTKFHEEVDKNAMSQAMINSWETVCEEHKQEIAHTKTELEVARNEIQKLTGASGATTGGGSGNSESTAQPSPRKRSRIARMSTGGPRAPNKGYAVAGASTTNTPVPPPPKARKTPQKRRAPASRSTTRKAKPSTTDS